MPATAATPALSTSIVGVTPGRRRAAGLAGLVITGLLTTLPVAPPAAAGPVGAAEGPLSQAATVTGPTGVASNGTDRHLVVWSEPVPVDAGGTRWEIRSRLVDADGTAVSPADPPRIVAAFGADGDGTQDALDAAVTWDPRGSRYLVAYAADTHPDVADPANPVDLTATEIFVQAVAADGTLDGARVQVSETCADPDDTGCDARRPDLSVDPTSGEVTVVWEANGDATPEQRSRTDVRARTLGADLSALGAPVLLSGGETAGLGLDPAVAEGPGGAALVTWSSLTTGGTLQPVAALVRPDGAGPTRTLAAGGDAEHLDVVADAHGWLVVWAQSGEVRWLRLGSTGATAAGPAALPLGGTAVTPRLSRAVDLDDWTLAWVDTATAGAPTVKATRFEQSGSAAPARLVTHPVSALRTGAASPTRPAVAHAGLTPYVVWSGEGSTLAPGESEAFGRVLGPDVDLRATVDGIPDRVVSGSPGEYPSDQLRALVTVTNDVAARDTSLGATVDVELPAGFVLDSDPVQDVTGPVAEPGAVSGGTLQLTVGALAPGAEAAFTVVGRPAEDLVAGTVQRVRATVQPTGGPTEVAPGDNTGEDTATVVAPPRVASSTPDPAGPAGAGDATFLLTFTEPVTGLDLADLFLTTTGTASGTLASLGTVDQKTFTVSVSGVGGNGTLRLDLPAGSGVRAVDDGTPVPPALGWTSGQSLTVDTTAPSVTLDGPTGPVAGSFDVTLTFSEPVTGLTTDDLVTDNATVTSVTGSGTSWTATLAPTADGTVTVDLPAGTVTDTAGNTNTASSTLTRTADTTRPTVTLSAPAGPHRAAFEVSIKADEPITGLALADLVIDNGTASDLTGSGTDWTVTVTPAADGTVTVNLPAGALTDVAGNTNDASATLTRAVDLTRPTVDLSAPAGFVRGAFDVTLTFSEPVTGLTAADLAVDNATVASVSGTGATWTATLTPTADGTVTVDLPAGTVTDAAGNANHASAALSRAVDLTRPTVVLTAPAGPRNGGFGVGLSFSEPVTGLTATDLTVDNGIVLAVSGYERSWTAAVIPTAEGQLTVDLPAGAVTDVAGNTNLASATLTRTVDLTGPTVELTAPVGPVNGPFEVSIDAHEPITGLTLADLVVGNGTAGDLTGSGTSWTASITPTADGTVTVDLPAGAVADAAGNSNEAGSQLLRTADLTRPTVDLDAPAGPHHGPFDVTLTFSEPVTGLAVDELSIGNGTASDLTGSGTRWTAVVTPTADGAVTVDLLTGAVTDAAGNTNPASTTLTRTADLTRPTVDLDAPAGPHHGPFDVTLTFSEPVTGLGLDDLEVTGATVSDLAGTGTTHTVRVTPSAEGDVTLRVTAGAATDTAGNTSVASAPLTRTVDRTAPSVTLTQGGTGPGTADRATIVATFSEPVVGLRADGVEVTGGTVLTVTGSGTRWEIGVALPGGSTTVRLPAAAARDLAGNASTASAPITLTRDTASPTGALSSTTPEATNASPILVTLRFDEPVTGLRAASFAVQGATVAALRGGGAAYELDVVPTGDGEVRVSLPAGSVVDGAGNGNLEIGPLVRSFESTGPTTTIEVGAAVTRAPEIELTVRFSKPVEPPAPAELEASLAAALAGAELVGSQVVDAQTMIVSVLATGPGEVVLDLPAGLALTGHGNPSSPARAVVTHDPVAPTATLRPATGKGSPTSDPEVAFTLRADEPISDLAADDVSVRGATRAGRVRVERLSPAAFRLTVTGMRKDGKLWLRVAPGAVTDAAGNPLGALASAAVEWRAPLVPTLTVDTAGARCLTSDAVAIPLRLAGPRDADLLVRTGTRRTGSPVSATVRGSGTQRTLVIRPADTGRTKLVLVLQSSGGRDRAALTVVVGTPGDDRLRGTSGPDVLIGRDGDDKLTGRGGRDVLCGGGGADTLLGGGGADLLDPGHGADTVRGGRGADTLAPRPGSH
ncbi:Ig-like domain-containing protein [Nocardioides sp. SYSU DS0663]|uniref:Ig-like domain-containing protein n=1 Tax=Nocardioides sp. SYSU DS0663 TaxID=3416445 RepID=UPI003F4B1C7A